MKCNLLGVIRNNKGHTLVEVLVVAMIASIFAVGLVSVYVNTIVYYKESVMLSTMYIDGMLLSRNLSKYFRISNKISLLQTGSPNDRVTLEIPSGNGGATSGGSIEIYFDSRSGTLRMNDGRPDSLRFNVALIPPIYISGRRRTQTFAYIVKSAVFEQASELIATPSDEYNLVRMRMVLQDPNGGDTLALQFATVNRNVQ